MTDNNPTFNIFGDPTIDDLRVGYISTDRGFVSGITICEANDYAKLNPGTIFILKNRKEIRYIDINEVNALTINDLFKETGDSCSGIQVQQECGGNVELDFFGGGGVGALGNPVIGVDGSVLAVDLATGGFGYTYAPTARIKDPCGIGAGAELRVVMLSEEDSISQLIEYDDEEDFEEYKICDSNEVGFGRRFDVRGNDTGEWNPNFYFDGGVLSFDEQLKQYTDFLLKKKNPWWTTRTEAPLRTTSGGVISRATYDVFHWAWGATPNPEGTGTIVGDLYLELFGRRPDSGGFKYWQDLLDSGKSVGEVRQSMMESEEFKNNELNGTKPVVAEEAFVAGSFWKVDKNNFMNKYAISPVPMSNVVPSDFGGQENYFEWDVDFPYVGDYKFKFQCDNQGSLYIDGQKKADYALGSGGAGGNVLSPPVDTVVGITSAGLHRVRVDIFNGSMMKKLIEQNDGLGDLATSNEVKFDVQISTYYGASATIDGLDITFEKTYGPDGNVNESLTKTVEYGRVYDVRITSNNRRTTTLPSNSKEIVFDGKGMNPGHMRRPSPKILQYDDSCPDDGSDWDLNASFTIDSGDAIFSEDGKSIIGTGEQTITLWWSDSSSKSGIAVNSIQIGSVEWKRDGNPGSITRTVDLGNGISQVGGENNRAVLRTKGAKVIEMEDIPYDVSAGSGGTGNVEDLYNDVIIAVDQGRFFDINGLNCKYTLGDRPAESGVSSTESAGEITTVFNTAEYIDKANRELWRTNPIVDKDSHFTNRYGITPKDPSLIYSGSEEGTHEIKWYNVNFPVSGEYDIGIGVDDNVTLLIGNEVNIYKEGFVPGTSTSTGTSSYRRFITAGVYTITAQLEQTLGGRLGYRNIAGEGAGRNPMTLAVKIDTVFTERDVQAAKSWNQNPFGVALTIEAPDPPLPQEPLPVQEGRCPPNPFWSTRFPNAEEQWFPFSDHRQIYRYGMSPVKPYGDENSSGGGQTYSNTWQIDAPYDGFYKLKVAADDSAVIKLDGNEVLRTVGLSTQSTQMVGINSGSHEITVEVTNIAQETFDTIDQRVFTTQGWAAIGTQVEQTLNTNEVDFDIQIATLYGATATIDGLDINYEKTYGPVGSFKESITRTVEFGRVYDVRITSNNRRVTNVPATDKELIFDGKGMNPGHMRRPSPKILQYDDSCPDDGSDWDLNASFTIDSGNAIWSEDGKTIKGTGEQTITLWWNDSSKKSGIAVKSIKIGSVIWERDGKEGSVTHLVDLGSGEGTMVEVGGENHGAVLRTKGENVLEMEDIPHVPVEEQKILYDDVVISASQGRFFDINGLNAKFVVERQTRNVMQGGVGSGTVKDGVVYSGPELYHKNSSKWGSFMNKASVSPNPTRDNATTEVVNYTWSNVDFPEDGEYDIKFQMDHSATLFLDGQEIASNNYRGVEGGDIERDVSGMGYYKKVLVNKGKHTLSVKPTVYTEASGGPVGFIDALFKQPEGYQWHENPSGFAIEIKKQMQIVRTDSTGKPVAKSWKENPVLVSAHLIPPPCPRLVEGIGVVKEVIPIDPGNGYPPPTNTDDGSNYSVSLELTDIIIEDGGINFPPDAEVTITGGPGDPVLPPITPDIDQFGGIIDIPIPPGTWLFTSKPEVVVSPPTGIPPTLVPVLVPRRTPVDVDPDRLLQVTDLVGLKQTGYYDGKPYYGAIFYKDGIKYAGWYETAGQLVQIYDTLQESIDAMVTTPPSAIQRQGSDIRSNDPRLNIPGTPDNLTY